jgi:hypothetical protein
MGELGLDPTILTPLSGTRLSQKQIGEIAQACVEHLTQHGRITNELLTFLASAYPITSSFPTSRTPDDRPELLSSDKMPSSAAATRRFTVPQLHRYLGFRQLKNWSSILDIAQENISLNLNHGDIPIELGNVANLKKSRANKTPVPCPKHFLSRVHMDRTHGSATLAHVRRITRHRTQARKQHAPASLPTDLRAHAPTSPEIQTGNSGSKNTRKPMQEDRCFN